MNTPQPIHRFLDRVQQGQNALCPTNRPPLLHTLAILLLSCPIDSVFNGEEEA